MSCTSVTCVADLLASLNNSLEVTSFLVYFCFACDFRTVDSIQECCHSNESAVCCTSVTCVTDLLASLEQLSRGHIIFSLFLLCM